MLEGNRAVDRIARLAHEAAFEASKWDLALGEVSSLLGASGSVVFTPVAGPRTMFSALGTAGHAAAEYVAHWISDDAWMVSPGYGDFEHAGAVHRGADVVATGALRRTGFYNDLLRRHDMEVMLSLRVCDGDDAFAPPTLLTVFRDPGADEFSDEQRLLLHGLWPHFQRAIRTYWALHKVRDHDRIVEQTLDALPQPAWVLHADATIAYANSAADALAGRAPWLRTQHGRLRSIGDVGSDTLLAVLRLAPLGGGRDHVAAYLDGGRLRRALLRVAPLAAAIRSPAWPNACALLTLELAPGDGAPWIARVAQHYRLTQAERRVLDRLAAGLTPAEIAAEQQVSQSTLRTHLRALFDKTHCRRQADLVRLALGS